jgi:hypothetical protein
MIRLPLLPASALLLAAAAVTGAARADNPPAAPAKPRSVFQQVIPQPTGRNGYEELVLAAEAFRASRYYEKAQEADTTLEFKREVLADRQVMRAFALLRQGLQKTVVSPRDSISIKTLLPEYSLFRSLARLLALQQYVYLADGRVAEALGNARMGLSFGRAVQTETLISGLVGLAISAVCIRPLADHLDQLSARDCESLYKICLEWLAQPDPQQRVMASEARLSINALAEIRDGIKKQGAAAAAKDLGFQDDEEAEDLAQRFPKTPEEIDAQFARATKLLQEHLARALEELKKPAWERADVELPADTDLAGTLARMIIPSYNRADQAYVRDAARMRMLACHCLIHRYKWEHNRLPSDLASVRPGDLAIDPFTGQPLQYTVRGSRYSLTSAGAPAADPDDPKAVNGRVPVSLTPDD